MSSQNATILPEVVDLLALPVLDELTDAQARGAVCVWDPTEDQLTAETAIDLGERQTDGGHWFPRACRPHTALRMQILPPVGEEATG
ncbi:hypothetical protein AB0D49_29500 [Streptomyces sp. NPDC048290]|uniref:hypothetical protein n=1 Tax=Streptomyces sp. NPDC048290 TaxID=3155811 RepID=UPI0034428E49